MSVILSRDSSDLIAAHHTIRVVHSWTFNDHSTLSQAESRTNSAYCVSIQRIIDELGENMHLEILAQQQLSPFISSSSHCSSSRSQSLSPQRRLASSSRFDLVLPSRLSSLRPLYSSSSGLLQLHLLRPVQTR